MIASCYGGGRSEDGSVCNGLEAVLVGDQATQNARVVLAFWLCVWQAACSLPEHVGYITNLLPVTSCF